MPRPAKESKRQRNGLLAKIHIGKSKLGLDDDVYRDLIEAYFGKRSAADLSIAQLEKLLGIFRARGFEGDSRRRAMALCERAREIAGSLPDGAARLQGLTFKICGVQRLEWCRDIGKLERLLAALGKIQREGYEWDGKKK